MTTPVEHAETLAGDLLRNLSHRVGDVASVEAELQRWTDLLGVPGMSMVCLEAVRQTFAYCLTPTPAATWPGGQAFNADERERAR